MNMIFRNVGAALGGQVAASIVAGHVAAGGMPANSGFELAFLMSTVVALLAGVVGLMIPRVRSAVPAARVLAVR